MGGIPQCLRGLGRTFVPFWLVSPQDATQETMGYLLFQVYIMGVLKELSLGFLFVNRKPEDT